MLYAKIENPNSVEMLDATTIILETFYQCEKVYNYGLKGKGFTLSDINKRYEEEKQILVITECGIGGSVYRYGNHGDYWEKIGETIGYA